MAKILITGGAGFIGSQFVSFWHENHPDDKIIVLDAFTYAADKRIEDKFESDSGVQFVRGDICDRSLVKKILNGCSSVFHFAAETHVDRSLLSSQVFLRTNIMGTQMLLECARNSSLKRFIHISTDEVYGSVSRGRFNENSPLAPSSPYSASKASSDLLCRAYWQTWRTPVIVTRCCNNFGPNQFPEKVIPLFITNLIEGEPLPLYGDGRNIREWIHVLDHCMAIETVHEKGESGEVYNIGSGFETSNLNLARQILELFGKPQSFIKRVKDRPGHDLRYALDSSKMRSLGWKPQNKFKEALEETTRWYMENEPWWKEIKRNRGYKEYFKKQYK